MEFIHAVGHALTMSFNMAWQILWPLILGFGLSGALQAVVSHKQMSKLLPDDSFKTLTKASLLGAASSSCSYAAVALSRSIFRKGANFTAAIAFELASTNLVIELGIAIVILLGWRFALAEYIGAPIMISILAVIFRLKLKQRMVEQARRQTEKGLSGKMEGHAAMADMSVSGRSLISKLLSPEGRTATSHYFVMDWLSVWSDIVIGLLVAGALAAFVPAHFWQSFFLIRHPLLSKIWGPLIGPFIAIISFVCSVGNIPLAAVLWNNGIGFGGVISFILADLIILPIIRIYSKYYGRRMAGFLVLSLYAAMAITGYIIEALFALLHLTPHSRHLRALSAGISWNYTTVLNIVLLILAGLLIHRFLRTGGPKMIRMMNQA